MVSVYKGLGYHSSSDSDISSGVNTTLVVKQPLNNDDDDLSFECGNTSETSEHLDLKFKNQSKKNSRPVGAAFPNKDTNNKLAAVVTKSTKFKGGARKCWV